MRIAQIATLARTVPPRGEGSVESLVFNLTEGLVRRGHEVTLYAAEGSRTSAALRSPAGFSYSVDKAKWNWQLWEAYQVEQAFRAAREFDVIHCHSYHHGLLYCDWVAAPSLHSFHVEPGPDIAHLANQTRNRHLHFCSVFQARNFTLDSRVSIISHGVDDMVLRPTVEGGGNYLAYLGRFMPDKGVEQAVTIAQVSGLPLLLAGPENEYFTQIVRPRLSAEMDYVGELATDDEKSHFLSKAMCLLYPVQRAEPFGLVLVESLMCGTPVIAPRLGAVPEIIEDGMTGFIVDQSAYEYAHAVSRLGQLDRGIIRSRAVERFSLRRMVDDLERTLLAIAGKGQTSE